MAVLDDDELGVKKSPQRVNRAAHAPQDEAFVREVEAGAHPEYMPLQYTKENKTINKPNRINIEAMRAPDGERRFVDFGENTEKNRKRLFTGRDDIGLTPAQAADYLGVGLDKDARFTSNLDIGVMNYNMPSDPLHMRSRMLNPARLRGNAEDFGVVPPKPSNPTTQKNIPSQSNVLKPNERDSRYMLPSYSQMEGDASVLGIVKNVVSSPREGFPKIESTSLDSAVPSATEIPFWKKGFTNTSGVKAFDIFERSAPKPENLSKTPTTDKIANSLRGKTGTGKLNQTLKTLGNVSRAAEKLGRSRVGGLAFAGAAIGLFSDGYDRLADNSLTIKQVRSYGRDPKTGAMSNTVKDVNVNRDTIKEFGNMLSELGTTEANKDLKDTFESMPTGEGRPATQRYSGGSAVKQFMSYANRANFDAADDPQLSGFIAQSLQMYKDARTLGGDTKKEMLEVGQAINSMAKQFVKERKNIKKAEWRAWADARGESSTAKKLASSFTGTIANDLGISGMPKMGTEWKHPMTGEIMYGAPEADPILERNMFAQ
jgi:hypothetical protein